MVEDWSFDGPLASNYVKNELSYDRFGGYKFLGSDRDSFSGLEGFSMFGADDPFNVGTESGSVNSNGNNNNNNNNNNNSNNNNNNGGARRMSGIGNFFSGFTGSLSSPSNSFSGPSSGLPQLHDFPSWELSSRNQSQQLSLPSVQQSQSQSQSQQQSPQSFNNKDITSDFDLNSVPLSSRSPIQRGLANRSTKGSFLTPPPLFPSPSSSFSSSNQSSSIPSLSLSLDHNASSTPISPSGGQFKTFDNLSSKNDNNLNNNNNIVSFQNSKSISQGEKVIFPSSSRIQPFTLPSSITSTSQSQQSQLSNDVFASGFSSSAYPIPTHLISIMDNNNNNNNNNSISSGRLSPAQNLRNIPSNKIKSMNPLSLPSPSSSASPSSSFSSLTSSSASSSPLSSISITPSSSLSSNTLATNSISSSSINPLATITTPTPTPTPTSTTTITSTTTTTPTVPPTKTRKAPNYPRRRRKRLVWTEALEDAFLKAMKELGDPNTVTPREILEKMSVPGLSRQNISSHLQNHRLKLSRKNHGQQSRRNRERLLDNYLATLSSVTGSNGFNQNDNSSFNQNDNDNDNSIDGLSPSSSFSSSSNMDSNDQHSESSLNIIDQDESGQKSDSSLPLSLQSNNTTSTSTSTSTSTTSFPSNSSGFSMGVNFLE